MNSAPRHSTASPRSFAIGAGIILIFAGTVLFLGACCLASFGATLDWRNVPPPMKWADYFESQRLPMTLALATLTTTFVGGLMLIAGGVGLYGERSSAGPLSSICTILLAILYGVLAGTQYFQGATRTSAILPTLLALVMIGLVPLAWRAAGVMRRHPPPPDQNAVNDNWLRENAPRRRREP